MKNNSSPAKFRIKLFVDAHVFDGIPQGTVTYLCGLYSELVNDSRFQLFIGSSDKLTAEKLLGTDNFIHIKYTSHSKFKRLFFEIPKVLKSNNIDFAHFQYISPLQKPCKYIVTIHDLLFLEYPENFPLLYRIKNSVLFYLSAKRADIVTTVSEYSKGSIHKFFNIPLSKIEITPNAVSKSQEQSEAVEHLIGKKFILFVSRIEPRKNQARLIRIWKELNLCDQNIDLVLVGSEGLKDDKFKQQILSLSVKEKEHFFWIQNVPSNKLIWLYQNCTLFIFPSSAEGFGIPPLEAAIYGAKVLCSNTTAMKEFTFFENHQFDPNNYAEFSEAILFSINREFDHQFAVSTIISTFNWQKIANDFGNLISIKSTDK